MGCILPSHQRAGGVGFKGSSMKKCDLREVWRIRVCQPQVARHGRARGERAAALGSARFQVSVMGLLGCAAMNCRSPILPPQASESPAVLRVADAARVGTASWGLMCRARDLRLGCDARFRVGSETRMRYSDARLGCETRMRDSDASSRAEVSQNADGQSGERPGRSGGCGDGGIAVGPRAGVAADAAVATGGDASSGNLPPARRSLARQ
jgi:hypothetical protein